MFILFEQKSAQSANGEKSEANAHHKLYQSAYSYYEDDIFSSYKPHEIACLHHSPARVSAASGDEHKRLFSNAQLQQCSVLVRTAGMAERGCKKRKFAFFAPRLKKKNHPKAFFSITDPNRVIDGIGGGAIWRL